jgi:hypothetical protein
MRQEAKKMRSNLSSESERHETANGATVGPETAHTPLRELAVRKAGGLEITLVWHADEDRLTVAVYDSGLGDSFEVPAPNDRALDVFYHPYAYAARRGIEYRTPAIEVAETVDV